MQLEQFMLVIKIQLKLLFVHLNILHTSEQLLTLFRMGFFRAAHGCGGWWVFSGGKKSPLPKIYHIFFFFLWKFHRKKKIYHMYPTMMELGSYTLPKENPKNIWITWFTPWVLLTSAFFTGNLCYIKKIKI